LSTPGLECYVINHDFAVMHRGNFTSDRAKIDGSRRLATHIHVKPLGRPVDRTYRLQERSVSDRDVSARIPSLHMYIGILYCSFASLAVSPISTVGAYVLCIFIISHE
jgi:hypothetical protein